MSRAVPRNLPRSIIGLTCAKFSYYGKSQSEFNHGCECEVLNA